MNRLWIFTRSVLSLLVAVVFWVTANAQSLTALAQGTDPSCLTAPPQQPYTPQHNAYFGDLHTHTSYSLDAYMGFMRNSPDDAYKFAQGNEITTVKYQLIPPQSNTSKHKVPLDFAAVTDHAEFIGEMEMALDPSNPRYEDPMAKKIRNKRHSEIVSADVFVNVVQQANRATPPAVPTRTEYGFGCVADIARITAWKKIQQATEENYKPGTFTTFHAFEWSSAPGGANLHRNVIFRDTKVPRTPLSAFDTQYPEELWDKLCKYEKDGSTVLAIPHNGNASQNMMFMPKQLDGTDIDPSWAQMRAKYEPLFEIMQIKGTSETLPRYAPTDEFADFELLSTSPRSIGKYSYIREALKNGLRHEQSLGTNPFKYGFVGATDNHNGAPGDTEEDDYVGSHGYADATPERRQFSEIPGWEKMPYLNPGALTGVWAEENNRENIFDALKRKETFATSGNRIQVRFFGGWNYADNLNEQPDAIEQAYANGVPMGGNLLTPPDGTTPKFFVWATKDPNGGNLDRIQIVKGWTKHGLTYEKIYNVAWAGDRQLDRLGKLPPIGSTVNVRKATYTNTIGSEELSSVWTDPDFDPTVPVVYYTRVLEIPTPRYSTHDAAQLGIKPNPISPTEIQERAWTSPIWHTPSAEKIAEGAANDLTVSQLEEKGDVPLTTSQIKKLVTGHTLTIKNRITGKELLGFFERDGVWFLGELAGLAPLHTGELQATSPTTYKVEEGQLIVNFNDGSTFEAEIFRQGKNKYVAARNDEIGYVNYDLAIDRDRSY